MIAKRRKQPKQFVKFRFGRQNIRVVLDKVLIFRFFRNLHGRFWGVTGISLMSIGFTLCFLIRPDLISVSTAFSDFGNDIRTAPYFAGSVFIGAYGMWRWRNYLSRTWKRAMPVTGLITLTVFGLYIVALVPLSWNNRLHMFGMILTGLSMLVTVVLDGLLTKPSARQGRLHWRLIRIVSFVAILIGGFITFGSAELVKWFNLALLGECFMLFGYLTWVGFKTYQGEGNRSQLSKALKSIVLID